MQYEILYYNNLALLFCAIGRYYCREECELGCEAFPSGFPTVVIRPPSGTMRLWMMICSRVPGLRRIPGMSRVQLRLCAILCRRVVGRRRQGRLLAPLQPSPQIRRSRSAIIGASCRMIIGGSVRVLGWANGSGNGKYRGVGSCVTVVVSWFVMVLVVVVVMVVATVVDLLLSPSRHPLVPLSACPWFFW